MYFPYSATIHDTIFSCDIIINILSWSLFIFVAFEHDMRCSKGSKVNGGGMSFVDVLFEAVCSCGLVAFSTLDICRALNGASE
jgi:hypothetical protein